jgi:hypothetical protein
LPVEVSCADFGSSHTRAGQQVKALAGPTTAHTSIDAAMRGLPAVRSLAVPSGDLRATYAAIIASAGVGDDAAFDRLLVDELR